MDRGPFVNIHFPKIDWSPPSFADTTNPQLNFFKVEIPQNQIDPSPFSPFNFNQPHLGSTQLMGGYPMNPKLELPNFDGESKKSVAWINKKEE